MKADVVLHIEGIEERGALEEHAEFAADLQQLALVHPGDVLAVDVNFAGVGRDAGRSGA